MAAPHRSAIGWTDYSGGDANFVTGCTPVSAGCANCYARAIYERFGRDFARVEWHPDKLKRLHRWKPRPPWKRERPMCFVVDTGDLFHEDVPFEFIEAAFALMLERADVDWQVLTKRPRRMQMFLDQNLRSDVFKHWPFPNVWLGVTAENQATADERIPVLLQVPAAVHFVSVEPMLEPVDLRPYLTFWHLSRATGETFYPTVADPNTPEDWHGIPFRIHQRREVVNWAICGGESGPNRRRFDVQWAVDLYYQCHEAGIPYWYKQGSALRPGRDAELPGFGIVQEWPEARGE
ncbi:MAG: DUF5131 family protein [Sideroxydans sp.]|nr:DUF5131 family protein [Sideroxydans sp.]